MSDLNVERAFVYTPQPGDVVVLECEIATYEQAAELKHRAEEAFGIDVKVVVLSEAHFAGVVRKEDA